jgi:hypothetical protein
LQRDSLNNRRTSLDTRRTELLEMARNLHIWSVAPTVAAGPFNLAPMQRLTLETVEQRAAQHPVIGSWTITSGFSSGQTLTFARLHLHLPDHGP